MTKATAAAFNITAIYNGHSIQNDMQRVFSQRREDFHPAFSHAFRAVAVRASPRPVRAQRW